MNKILKKVLGVGILGLGIGLASCSSKKGLEVMMDYVPQVCQNAITSLDLESPVASTDSNGTNSYTFYFKESIQPSDIYTSGSLSGKEVKYVTFNSKTSVTVMLTGIASSTNGWGAIVVSSSAWEKAEVEPASGKSTQFAYRCVVGSESDQLTYEAACTKVGTTIFDVLSFLK